MLVAVKPAGVGPWGRLAKEAPAMLACGTLNLPVGKGLDLANAIISHRALDGAAHKPGKIVLKVAD